MLTEVLELLEKHRRLSLSEQYFAILIFSEVCMN